MKRPFPNGKNKVFQFSSSHSFPALLGREFSVVGEAHASEEARSLSKLPFIPANRRSTLFLPCLVWAAHVSTYIRIPPIVFRKHLCELFLY